MSRLLVPALGLCLAGGLQAQTMYKCTGADGKTAFSDRPCATGGSKQEVRAAPSAGQAELDAELARKWGVYPEDIAALRARCAAGDKRTCREIERMVGSTAAEVSARAERRLIEERKALARKDALARERELCRGGNQAACDRVQQMLSEQPSVQPSDEYSPSYRRRR